MAAIAETVRTLIRDVVLNTAIASPLVPRPLRWRALRLAGLPVERSAIAPGGHYGGRRIRIGRGAFVNYGVFLDNTAEIEIGDGVQIGPQVTILTGSHRIGPSAGRAGAPVGAPVSIGPGAWIGARVVVLPGVSIGAGCVVAAGAVVTRDCQPDRLYAGVPAREVRSLED